MNRMISETRSHPRRATPTDAPDALAPPKRAGAAVLSHDSIRSLQDLKAYNGAKRRLEVKPAEGAGIDLDVKGLRNDRFGIWRVISPSGFRASVRDGEGLNEATIWMTLRGRLTCRDHVAEPGFGLLVSVDDISDFEASADFESLNFLFRKDVLADQLDELAGETSEPALDFEAVADLSSPALCSFRRSVLSTFERLTRITDTGGVVDGLMEEILLYQLIGSWPRAPARRQFVNQGSSRHVQRALDFIEAHLAVTLSVADVAAAAGVGVRALQSSFRRDLGRTPIQHIIERRLEQAHDDLRKDERSPISVIATRWGFIHMSDFSRRYRQRFGCTPSETQIRASRRA